MCPRETEKNVKSAINRNYTKIIYKLDPQPVIVQLLMYGVLTVAGHDVYYEELKNKIECGKTKAYVNERLLEILFTREKWWIPFVKALRECGACEIAEIIEAVLPWREKQKLKQRRQQNQEPARYTTKLYNEGHCVADLVAGDYLPSPGNAAIIKVDSCVQREHPTHLNFMRTIACTTPRNQDLHRAVSSEDGDAIVPLTLETPVRQVPVGVLNILHKLDTFRSDWQEFAGHLSNKFTMDSLHKIDNMKTASKTEEVIEKFARVEGKMATFGRIISALQKMQRRDLLDEIEELTQCKFSNDDEEDDGSQVDLDFKDPDVTPADNKKTSKADRVATEHEDHEDNYDDGEEEDETEGAVDLEEDKEETCLRHGLNESGDTKDETQVKKASDAHVDDMSTEDKKRQEDSMRQTTHYGAADVEVEMKDIQTRERDDTKMRQLVDVEDGFGPKICSPHRLDRSGSAGPVSFIQNQTLLKGVQRDQSVPEKSIYLTTAMGYDHFNNPDKSSPCRNVQGTQPNNLDGPKVNTRHQQGDSSVSNIYQNVPTLATGFKMSDMGEHFSSADAHFNNVKASQTQPKEKWSPEYSLVPQPEQHPRSHIPRFSTHYEEQDVPLSGLNGRDQTFQASSSSRPPQTGNTLKCQNRQATLCSQTNTFGHHNAQANPPDLNQTSTGSLYLSSLNSSVVQEPSAADYRNVPYPAHIMSVSLPSVPPSCHERQAQTALQQSIYPNANTEYELVTPRPCKEDDDISIDEGEAVSTAHGGPRAPCTGAPPESSQSPVGPGGRAETVEKGAISSVKIGLKSMFRKLQWVMDIL